MRKNTRWKRHITTRQNIRSFDKAKDTGFSPRRGKTGALPPLCGFPTQDAKKNERCAAFCSRGGSGFFCVKTKRGGDFPQKRPAADSLCLCFFERITELCRSAVPAGAGRFSFGFAAALRLRRSSRRQCFFRQSLIYCAKQLDLGLGNKL